VTAGTGDVTGEVTAGTGDVTGEVTAGTDTVGGTANDVTSGVGGAIDEIVEDIGAITPAPAAGGSGVRDIVEETVTSTVDDKNDVVSGLGGLLH
jgi:hypothetical protein